MQHIWKIILFSVAAYIQEIESENTLANQERGKEWEYRVFAVNKAGEGEPSNTVMTVL